MIFHPILTHAEMFHVSPARRGVQLKTTLAPPNHQPGTTAAQLYRTILLVNQSSNGDTTYHSKVAEDPSILRSEFYWDPERGNKHPEGLAFLYLQ